ncbi:hypothetical protein ACJMK2_029816, partial [Sinanodonta woodiana]
VVLVRWNEPYQKLATCDSQGIIFVWIKHEGRWSIELINDRNSQVTDFAWSHDGRMALICYCDGFVLVGSVAGQRFWSSMLNLDGTSITCGVWSPDDHKVMFGTTDGQIIVMNSTGAMVSQVTIHDGMEISTLAWSCEKFNMEENDANKDSNIHVSPREQDIAALEKKHTLAVSFKYGAIYLMQNYDDVCPRVVHTLLTGLRLDWSNCGEYLAVGGFTRLPNLQCRNEIHFYSKSGQLIHWETISSQGKPLTALCWGHNDRRLFIAAGHHLFVAWVNKQVPLLQYICQRRIQQAVKTLHSVYHLPIPAKLRLGIQALFSPTIKSYIPNPFKLREFVSTPPPGNERLFCTMVRHGEETSGGHYTLYLEYLGGLIPLLKGKRASKLRPDFVIFDPKIRATGQRHSEAECDGENICMEYKLSSDSDSDSDVSIDGCGSPRVHRKRNQKAFRPGKVERSTTFRTLNDLLYNDNLPESSKLVEVTSNIWGTKFRLVGIASHLPEELGNVLYKTSLLHLQPRQMTVNVSELPRDQSLLTQDQNFTPAGASEEENDDLLELDYINPIQDMLTLQRNGSGASFETANHIKGDITVVDILQNNQFELINSNEDYLGGNSSVSNSNNHVERQGKAIVLKTKLSPASESHPQNNHAFNMEYEFVTTVKDSFIMQGARPKIPQWTTAGHVAEVNVMASEGLQSAKTFVHQHIMSPQSSPKSSTSQSNPSCSNNQDNSLISDRESLSYFRKDSTESQKSNHSCSSSSSEKLMSNEQNDKIVPSLVNTLIHSDAQDNVPRWADPAVQGIKYIDDEDTLANMEISFENNSVCDSSQSALTPTDTTQKRLYLASHTPQEMTTCKTDAASFQRKTIGKNSDSLFKEKMAATDVKMKDTPSSKMESGFSDSIKSIGSEDLRMELFSRHRKSSDVEITQSASLPASPIRRLHKPDSPTKRLREEVLKGKCKHYSPLFKRKSKYYNGSFELDEEFSSSSLEDMHLDYTFKNLESFQKAQLKQKLRKVHMKGDDRSGMSPQRCRQFVMHNKAPLWNENSQVYQLDFGGRVTQESAKNFQIEFRGKQVMQFGRIDGNAYTLDFQYPFTAIQAFGVALANVTQRLK